jgi:glycine cleavage system H protein
MDYTIPDDLRYTVDDEWVSTESDPIRVGVTDFAQEQLGDIVYVELPKLGDTITRGNPFGVIESVKAVSDLMAPFSGEVVGVNERLVDTPELINQDCYGEGWMIEIQPEDPAELDALDAPDAYASSVRDRSD